MSANMTGDGVPDAPWTTATRARMVVASEAAELADRAGGFVPVVEHNLAADGSILYPGMTLEDARGLATAAKRFLEHVVVYERLGGTNWKRIGDVLDLTEEAARERFEPLEER